MESENETAPLPSESIEGIGDVVFKSESEVAETEVEKKATRSITIENIPDCNRSCAKSTAVCISPLNEIDGNIDNADDEEIIKAVAEPLSDLNLGDKSITKFSPEETSNNGNASGSIRDRQNEACSSHQKTKPLCGDSVNDDGNSPKAFNIQNASQMSRPDKVVSNSNGIIFKQTEPHLNTKDGQANQLEAETCDIKAHIIKQRGKLDKEGELFSKNETPMKRNPDEKLLESVPCTFSTNSFVSETVEPSTSSGKKNSDYYFNFTLRTENFKFPSTSISQPSFSSTCLLNSGPGASSDLTGLSSNSLVFSEQVSCSIPDQPVLVAKTSCAAQFNNKLILPATSRESAFHDFKKEIKSPPDKFFKQLFEIGNNNSNHISSPSQKCEWLPPLSHKNLLTTTNCLTHSEKVDKQHAASNSSDDDNQAIENRMNSNGSETSAAKQVTSSEGTETTIPLYSSSPFGFSFQGKQGLSSFSNLSRGEFSFSQSYGKLSFQPLTTHSINFPISCSRTDSNCTEYRTEDANSPFLIHNTERGSANPSKLSCSFNFSLKEHNAKKVNNYDESFWHSLGGKVVKTDTCRADSEATLMDSTCKSSIKKKQPFSFYPKDTQSDKDNLHRHFSFTSFFPALGSSSRSSPEKGKSVEHSTATQFLEQPASQSQQFQPISLENNMLNFKFKPNSPLSYNAKSIGLPPQRSTCYVVPSLCQNNAFSSIKSSANPPDSPVAGNGLPIPTSSTLPLLAFPGIRLSTSPFQSHGSPHHTRKSRKGNKLSKASTKFKERVTFQFSNTGMAPVPFKNVIGNDVVVTNGSTTTYVIRYQHISCMEEYKSVSPEELRFDYYSKKNAPFSDDFFTFCAGPDNIPPSNPVKQVKNMESQTDEQGKSSIPKVALQEVWRALECPVCLDVVLPPVFQCEQGHHACASCWNKMVSCPLCKRRKSSTRNYMAETLLEQVPLPCRYHIEGCRETVQRASKLIHEQTCMYRMYQCPYHLCNQAFSYHNMCKHFKKIHKSLLHQDGYSVTNEDEFSLNIYKDQLLPSLIHAVHIPRWGLFFIRQSSARFSTAIFVQVMHAAPDIPELSYHVEVSDHHDCRKQSYKGHVSPLGKLVREIIDLEEYLAVTDLLLKSVKKDAPVKISLTVWPRKPSLSLNLFSM